MCFPGDWSSVPRASNGQLALSSFDGAANGGSFGVVLLATYYDDSSAAGDAPIFGAIAASLRAEHPGLVHALVSLKGASSCLTWGSGLFTGESSGSDAIAVLDDPDAVLH